MATLAVKGRAHQCSLISLEVRLSSSIACWHQMASRKVFQTRTSLNSSGLANGSPANTFLIFYSYWTDRLYFVLQMRTNGNLNYDLVPIDYVYGVHIFSTVMFGWGRESHLLELPLLVTYTAKRGRSRRHQEHVRTAAGFCFVYRVGR